MGIERPAGVVRPTRAIALAKEVTPASRKHAVSAATIFKQRPQNAKRVEITSRPIDAAARLTANPSSAQKPARSSTRSPQKGLWEVQKKRADDVHPLAVVFKDTANEYRKHLYTTATARLDATLSKRLTTLHESNLSPISSAPNTDDPHDSPVKLTIPAKYDRVASKVFRSLREYNITSRQTNENGEQESVQTTLEEKLVSFEERYKKEAEEIMRLESQWEQIVSEIWKVGTQCLGEDAMSELLEQQPPSSPARNAEPTLFVPEQGSSPLPTRTAENKDPKKHVTFQTPQRDLPRFLLAPSVYRNHPIPTLPDLPEKEAKTLEDVVAKLGVEQIDELKRIDKEQQKWWGKKTQQIAMALGDD